MAVAAAAARARGGGMSGCEEEAGDGYSSAEDEDYVPSGERGGPGGCGGAGAGAGGRGAERLCLQVRSTARRTRVSC